MASCSRVFKVTVKLLLLSLDLCLGSTLPVSFQFLFFSVLPCRVFGSLPFLLVASSSLVYFCFSWILYFGVVHLYPSCFPAVQETEVGVEWQLR